MTDDDYQRDYSAGLNGSAVGNVYSPGYAAGEAARGRAAESSERLWAAGEQMGVAIRKNPLKFFRGAVIQTVVAAVVVGLIAAGLALAQQKPPLAWALPAAVATAALFAIVLTVWMLGFALGLALRLVVTLIAMPFVLWRWLLVFGAIGAGAGFALATTANRTSTIAQQQAIDLGLKGLLVGFVIGSLYRLMRALGRRGRPETPVRRPGPESAARTVASGPPPQVPVPGWTPTHVVPAGGMAAWDAPDPARPPIANLQAGVELVVQAQSGAWAQVRGLNGWSGWVDDRLLVARS